MKNVVALLSLPFVLSACATAPGFVGAAQSHGLSQVAVGQWVLAGCGNINDYARKFTAVDAAGQKVNGMMCGGLLGPTVFAAPVGQAKLIRLGPGAPIRLAAR
jgi:hypothetical protein